MPPIEPLAPESLYTRCDPAHFSFETTDELEELEIRLGQDRALEALDFGTDIACRGYNMFALGPPGTGKHTMVRQHLEEIAGSRPVPMDWCYVNNFTDAHKPLALDLPPGRGRRLRDDMERAVGDLREAIPALFESEDYRTRREALEEQFRSAHEKAFSDLNEKAQARQIALIRTPMGLALAPVRDGNVIEPREFAKLPEDEQTKTRHDIEELEGELQKIMRAAPVWEKEHREKIRALNKEMTDYIVSHTIDALRDAYKDLPKVCDYIENVRRDIVENVPAFVMRPEAQQPEGAPQQLPTGPDHSAGLQLPFFRRYMVNLIVDHAESKCAPVIYDDHPTQANLIGRIEHMAQYGALMTDFALVKAGSLLQANGGYLILDATKVLTHPYAWEELKRSLRANEVRIEGLAEALGFASTISLQPERIPLDIKVVLVGDRQIYYLLTEYDPEFEELFKVQVDFDDVVDRSPGTTHDYARMVATIVRNDGLRALDPGGVARVIEHASRLVSDSEKLSARMRLIVDLLHETHHYAGKAGAKVAGADHVQQAIDAQIRRADRIRERSHEQIERNIMLIDTAGAQVGQVNGLSVLQIGGFSFGQPTRITARVRVGRGEVVDIEREAKLGGPIHSKGVMILAGFLGQRYARNQPLALAASLVFEQSYGGVEGDSASSTELYALLSALSGVPIRQCFAVTGSVNQHGHIQPIGGVNEKIEGYYDICKARGLSGEQGVLIPFANVKHLMLRHDIVMAAREKKFRIFAVKTIDQGIEILTGIPAGALGEDGKYPADSMNGLVQAELTSFAEKARAWGARAQGGGEDR